MIYPLHKFLVGTIMRLFFRKIYIEGLDKLPKNDPQFIVSNHPTGFWEPCIYACGFPFVLHFLTRGDLFQKKAFRWFLEGTNQLPIFRKKDGFAHLRENKNSQSVVAEQLVKGAKVVIFAEGSSKQVKYLRPLKTGMARMSFQAYQLDNSIDLKIVPVGVSFEDFMGFRKDVIIKIGDPIDFKDHLGSIQENQSTGVKALTKITEDALDKLIVKVKDPQLLQNFNLAIPLIRNQIRIKEPWLPIFDESGIPFKVENNLIEKLKDPDIELIQKLKEYNSKLEKNNTYDKYVLNDSLLKRIIASILLAPFAFVGLLFNLIPTGITTLLSIFVIPKNRFFTSLSGLSRLLIHFYLFYPIATIVLFFNVGWVAILFAPIAVICEWLMFRFGDQVLYVFHYFKMNVLNKKQMNELKEKRSSLLKELKEIG